MVGQCGSLGARGRPSYNLRMNPVEHLNFFVAKVDVLLRERIFEGDNWQSTYTLSWDRMKGTRFAKAEPDGTMFRSYLLEFRRYFAQQGPLYLGTIFNVCHHSIRSDELKGYLVKARAEWRKQATTGGIAIRVNGEPIAPEETADLWINGMYFHDEPRKYERLRELAGPTEWLSRMQLVNFVTDCTRITLYVQHVIRVALANDLVER